ncbi:Protein ROOT INITIATION DEFECTIVE 3 [Melia azedarach]|uniref:Protein ROOT INITIATION DEFECTIVE 3 n=1 Tax=Melia azedarach TaxID=155640 RepID=A0ACC1YTP5_MELAZ|nr:Protein ROOT INITIATION DEFECTIVE 3 [Melia azedarach]
MSSSSSSASSFSLHEIVLTSSPEGPITAYNPSSGAILAHFSGSRSPRRGLTFAGKSFIAASHISPTTGSGSIHLYNWWSSTPLHNIPVPEPVAPLATTSDGSYLFTGGLSGNIYAISIPKGDILRSFSAHNKPASCLKISEDGSLLISGGDDGVIVTVSIFQLVDGHSSDKNSDDLMLQKFVAHNESVTAITSCMGSCNSIIITCSMDCTCKFWRLLNGTHLSTLIFPCAIMGFALDPTETDFFAAGSDGLIYKGLLKFESRKQMMKGQELETLGQKHDGMVVSVVMMKEGRNLVSAAEDGSVFIWEIETGQVLTVLGSYEMAGNISDMVIATGISTECALKMGESGNESGQGIFEKYGEKLLSMSIKSAIELENVMKVAGNDRSKAIGMLESAIAMYEKLLELILKEAIAMGGSSTASATNASDVKHTDDE